ncbi:sensor histidine kinase [Neorhizobium galegae]|uniref:sensor histidine kinase n=1 Tax=Neorhizobium galegae TaxID=399 RepID=UPI00062100EE|nr:sensor histidine kinase [Neorhizobium galegae]CDZ25890.1 Signal transduction histidine kinase [Neorhizobium galegae bv. officinalis]KAA9388459.1 HAMP domain-containing protein [Neorhizobium galegae]KAB1114814.1 HAMP domain-containing protein [Neorhizobium galegae]MCM2497094.1 sensor histidine kinase [Neorhizobium galegae]MCQ1771162.1 sensor histidine kinase [Neorhizobium galegae]
MFRVSRFFPTAPIGAYLVALAAGVALPLLIFVGYLMTELEANEREILAAETAEDAQLIARSIDRELQDMATTLRLLVTSPELEAGDLRAFHNRTQSSLRSNSLYILVVNADGQQRLNTRVPFDAPLGKVSNMLALQSALNNGVTEVSNVFFGATSGKHVFNVTMPLPKEISHSGAAMIMTQNAEDLQKLISTEGLPAGWSVAVVDGAGNVVTSLGAHALGSGTAFPADMLKLMTGFKGTIEDVDGNRRQMYGYAQITGWTWKTVVWGPIDAAQASILTTWRQLIAGGAIFLALGMLIAWFVGRQLRIPIRQIAEMAERIGKGEIVSPVETKIREANQVAVALSNASFDRSEAEDRIHLILHELVHRTKNILTLIQAMMRQLARQDTTMEEFQKAISTRLQGLGKSIEALAKEQWAGVSIRRVIEIHMSTFADAADRVELQGTDFILKAEAVQNLGLILHELATNSVKYGALSVPQGRVRITWKDTVDEESGESRLELVWEERDGPAVHEPSRTGFGTTIIRRHAAAAFAGQVEVDFRTEGLRWSLNAPRLAFERGEGAETLKDIAI